MNEQQFVVEGIECEFDEDGSSETIHSFFNNLVLVVTSHTHTHAISGKMFSKLELRIEQ